MSFDWVAAVSCPNPTVTMGTCCALICFAAINGETPMLFAPSVRTTTEATRIPLSRR